MIADIRRLLRQNEITITQDQFEVSLPGERKQTVHIAEHGASVRLWSVVASRGAAARADGGAAQLLRQNRYTELVEFSIDPRGRWIAQAVLPPTDVSAEEVHCYVRAIALSADRMEQVLTGSDDY